MADIPAATPTGTVASDRAARRAVFVQWLRRTHGWFGLWGALIGLILGTSGIWLNHRAVMKLELPSQQITNAQLPMPGAHPATAPEMAAWLQQALKLDRPASNTRVERARPVPWTDKGLAPGERNEKPLMQPERWIFSFGGPDRVIQADYWVGNRSIGIRTTSNGLIAALTNMHKGVGMPLPWILLIDTMAGSLIFLSLSGALLWWLTTRRRRLGVTILGLSVAVTGGVIAWSLQA